MNCPVKYPDLINPEMSRIGVAESQMYNVVAGMLLTETIKTALGPRGMEKMYVDILGEEMVTKHGGAFLRKIDVDHPAAKAVVDAVNSVDNHVSDGTVSTAVFVGALLGRAKMMLSKRVPTAAIVRGFEMGAQYALEALDDIRIKAEPSDLGMKRRVVASCLDGKVLSNSLADRSFLIDAMVEAAERVTDPTSGRVDTDLIKIEEKHGNSADIELVRGTVIDKPADSAAMPDMVTDAKVLLLNDPLEAMRTKTESQITITAPGQMSQFCGMDDVDAATIKGVLDSGAKLVVSRKGIGDLVQGRLAGEGIISVRRAKYNDLWWLEKSTGAKTCSSVYEIGQDELGFANTVRQKVVGGDAMIFAESETPGSVTLLLRANSKRYLDEFHRTVLNATRALRNYAEEPFVLYGGGSCEAILAKRVREQAPLVEGKEQKVLEGFAYALELIPETLARNAGMNPLDAMPMLRSRCASDEEGWWGIDSASRRVAKIRGVIDTYPVKRQMIKSAVEATNQILNVDDVFMRDLIDNTHCHLDGTVHAHKDPGRNHNHWEQEGLEQRQMHQHY